MGKQRPRHIPNSAELIYSTWLSQSKPYLRSIARERHKHKYWINPLSLHSPGSRTRPRIIPILASTGIMSSSPTISIGHGASNFTMHKVNLNNYSGDYHGPTTYHQPGSEGSICNGPLSGGLNAHHSSSMRPPSRMDSTPAALETIHLPSPSG